MKIDHYIIIKMIKPHKHDWSLFFHSNDTQNAWNFYQMSQIFFPPIIRKAPRKLVFAKIRYFLFKVFNKSFLHYQEFHMVNFMVSFCSYDLTFCNILILSKKQRWKMSSPSNISQGVIHKWRPLKKFKILIHNPNKFCNQRNIYQDFTYN